jgi:phage/plasmid-like protein (TIGR03299 family)
MAHELLIRNGQAAMLAVGNKPWHGLGVRLDHPPTTKDAICLARLDWHVRKASLYADDLGDTVETEYFATVRDPIEGEFGPQSLGIVRSEYEPLQNTEAFAFFDPLLKTKEVTIETAGALGKGERVWVSVKVHRDFAVGKDDLVESYLLLANSHDGSSSVQIKFTPVRVVCANTLDWALSAGQSGLQIRHDRSMRGRLHAARCSLEFILGEFGKAQERFMALRKVPMDSGAMARYLKSILPDPHRTEDEDAYSRRLAIVGQRRATTAWLFENGQGNQAADVRGSLWAAYNGVTELADHYLPIGRNGGWLESIWFGEAHCLKRRALEQATRMLTANMG